MYAALLGFATVREAGPWRDNLTLAPDNFQAEILLVNALMLEEQYAEAEPLLQRVLAGSRSSRSDLHMALGVCKLKLEKWAEAEMREALRLRPQASVQYRAYRYYLGDLLERKGDLHGALEEYAREVEEYPDEAWVLDRELEPRPKIDAISRH